MNEDKIKEDEKWDGLKGLVVNENSTLSNDTNYNFRAYEDLHGFDMLHTYDDIVDLRFIVNYTF